MRCRCAFCLRQRTGHTWPQMLDVLSALPICRLPCLMQHGLHARPLLCFATASVHAMPGNLMQTPHNTMPFRYRLACQPAKMRRIRHAAHN